MEKNLHEGHRARLKERALLHGIDAFNEHQVLELLLSFVIPRMDTNPIAHRLINHFGSLGAVMDASCEDIMQINGIGNASAQFLHLLPSLFKAYRKSKMQIRIPLNTFILARDYFMAFLQNLPREEFYLACLDSDLNLIQNVLISKGMVNQAKVHIREITQIALKFNASCVMLAHNHPNGRANPSPEDLQLTKRIVIGLGLNGIDTIDHLIVGKENTYSFEAEDVLGALKNEFKLLQTGAAFASSNKPYITTDYQKQKL